MTLHDEGIETVIRWLEQCDSLYEREYAQNAIKGLREFQTLRSLESCPYCGSVEAREKLQQQNKKLREHSKRLAKTITSLKEFVNLSELTFKKKDGSCIGSGEALMFGQLITNIDESLKQHEDLIR